MVPTPASASLYAQSHELDVLDKVACVMLFSTKGAVMRFRQPARQAPVNICGCLRTGPHYQIIKNAIIIHAIFMAVCEGTTHPLLHLLTVLV